MASPIEALKTIFAPVDGGKEPEDLSEFLPDTRGGSSGQYSWMYEALKVDYDRRVRYKDYEDMEESVLISAALDLYADGATPYDTRRKATAWVTVKGGDDKKEAQDILDEAFDRWEMEDRIYSLTYDLAKYGEVGKFLPSKKKRVSDSGKPKKDDDDNFVGVYALEDVPFLEVEPIFDKGRLQYFRVGKDERKPWEFFYTRLRTKTRTYFAGDQVISSPMSMTEGARRHWRMLRIMETALSIARVSRGMGSRTFYVDNTGLGPNETRVLLEWYRRKFKRNVFISQTENKFDMNVNLISAADDIFWPTNKDNSSRIEYNNNNFDVRAIEDIKYFREQVMIALKVPPEYLGLDAGGLFDKGLAQKDVKFAHMIRKLQRAMLQGITTLCQIELALHGLDPETIEFEVGMAPISYLEELQKVEVLQKATDMSKSLLVLGESLGIAGEKVWLDYMIDTIVGFVGETLGMSDIKDLKKLAKPPSDPTKVASIPTSTTDTPSISASDENFHRVVEQEEDKLSGTLTEIYGPRLATGLADRLGEILEQTMSEASSLNSKSVKTVFDGPIVEGWDSPALNIKPTDDKDNPANEKEGSSSRRS